jgi:hypothetical protein
MEIIPNQFLKTQFCAFLCLFSKEKKKRGEISLTNDREKERGKETGGMVVVVCQSDWRRGEVVSGCG